MDFGWSGGVSTSGGTIGGGGTLNTIAMFTPDGSTVGDSIVLQNSTTDIRVNGNAYIGGNVTPTAVLHLKAGRTAAGSAPIKLTTGVSMTTPEAGAIEFTTDDLFFTITTGAARKRITMADPVGGLTAGRVPYVTTNGRLTDSANMVFTGTLFGLGGVTPLSTLHVSGSTGFLNVVGSSGTVTLGAGTIYVFTGSTATYSLPTGGSTVVDRTYFVKNRGSGNVTLDVTGGGTTIYTTSAQASVTIAAGEAVMVSFDGSFWNLFFLD